jgi:hypothetical protein
MSLDDALAELKRVRSEAASHRAKLAQFEKAQQEAETARLSDLEKAQKKVGDLERERDTLAQTMRDRIARYAIEAQATRLGIVDPDVAATLIASELEFAEDGTPTNVEKLLRTLLEKKPYLASSASPTTPRVPVTNPGRGSAPAARGGNALSHELIASMTPQQYAARAPEIRRWLAQNPKA